MSEFIINPENAQKKRLLTTEEELTVLRWAHDNPHADIDSKIKNWMQEFNCSEFSIIQVFVKEHIGQIRL